MEQIWALLPWPSIWLRASPALQFSPITPVESRT